VTLSPQAAGTVLDGYFLEVRSKLLDLAAILDRIDRGGGMPNDPRLQRIHEAIGLLVNSGAERAEQVQTVFSLAYDSEWKRPTPA
jgi:hypothetical protein